MTTPKAPRKTTPSGRTAALGPGIHAATVVLKNGASYRVKLLDGRRAKATLAPGVSSKLLDECLRTRRLVMLADGERGPAIIGVLQTAPVPQVQEEGGEYEVKAKKIRLKAGSIVLETDSSTLVLEESGLTRITGNRLVIDVSTLLRVLATKVDLP